MATTSSDENVSITISKETIKSVKMLALVIIVGIIVVGGGFFLKEMLLDPTAEGIRGSVDSTIDRLSTASAHRELESEAIEVTRSLLPEDSEWRLSTVSPRGAARICLRSDPYFEQFPFLQDPESEEAKRYAYVKIENVKGEEGIFVYYYNDFGEVERYTGNK